MDFGFFFKIWIFGFFLEKKSQNVISQKLQRLEQPFFEAKIATPGTNLAEPHYRDQQTSHLRNLEHLRSSNLAQDLQLGTPESTLTVTNYKVGIFKSFEFLKYKVFKFSEKN